MACDKRSADSALLTAQSGFSLVEMLVAILLTAVIVMGTFSALLLTKADLGSSDNQMLISQSERALLETLKSYQAASLTTGIPGPGPNGGWNLSQEVGAACTGANCPTACAGSICACGPASTDPGCSSACTSSGQVCATTSYALRIGCGHNVSTMLPTAIQNPPYNGVMCYTVTDQSGNNYADPSQFMPQVQVTVQWTRQGS